MPAIVVTSAPSDELLSLEEAKQQLRVLHDDLDGYIQRLIAASRDYCERWTGRTLRTAVERTISLANFWRCDYHLPFPPLLAVTSITYFDEDDVQQTLDPSNYYVELSTDGGGRIVWADGADIPSLFARPDAVTITYTAGYASAAACPPVVLQAIRLKLTEFFGVGTVNELEAASESVKRLLNTVDWTGYA